MPQTERGSRPPLTFLGYKGGAGVSLNRKDWSFKDHLIHWFKPGIAPGFWGPPLRGAGSGNLFVRFGRPKHPGPGTWWKPVRYGGPGWQRA